MAIYLVDVMNYIYTTKSSFDSRIQPFPSTQSLFTLSSSSSSRVPSIAGIDAVSDVARWSADSDPRFATNTAAAATRVGDGTGDRTLFPVAVDTEDSGDGSWLVLFGGSIDSSVSTDDIGDVNIDEANDVNDDVDTD